jgi:hypothetical protein
MALRMGALYDALRHATGITEEDARRAAEEVAGYESRIARIEADLVLLKWMVGTNLALTLIVLGLIFQIFLRLPK